MTNGDKIRYLTNEELAEYIEAVYIAGQYKIKYGLEQFPTKEINYIAWLNMECDE